MAYEAKNLSVLAYSNGFTLWHYATADAATDVDSTGYFNEAWDMLRTGDMIMANSDDDMTPKADIFLVTTSDGKNKIVTVLGLCNANGSNSSATSKPDELTLLQNIYSMGVESLSPDEFTSLICILNSLACNRKIYEPRISNDNFEGKFLNKK